MGFLLVEFTTEQTSAVVLDLWVIGSSWYWPTPGMYSGAKVAELFGRSAAADRCWQQHLVRVLGRFGMWFISVFLLNDIKCQQIRILTRKRLVASGNDAFHYRNSS